MMFLGDALQSNTFWQLPNDWKAGQSAVSPGLTAVCRFAAVGLLGMQHSLQTTNSGSVWIAGPTWSRQGLLGWQKQSEVLQLSVLKVYGW